MSVKSVDPREAMFHNEDAARDYFEDQRWPEGPVCPHCQSKNVHRLDGHKHRVGLLQCRSCQGQFTVMTGTVMESSHIPLPKWALAFHKMAASKKGISAKQLQRELALGSYRTAWFMAHRIREAMGITDDAGPIGGEGKTIESDETFVGGKKKNVHKGKPDPKKHVVMALTERNGKMRAKHVPDVTAKTIKKTLRKHANKASILMTDDSTWSREAGKTFKAHGVVKHSLGEYVVGDVHTQTIESFFAILKRGITGSFHSVSEKHLQRYVDEFAFRWNARSSLGIEDAERAALMVKGAEGKRLTYRLPNKEKTQH